MRWRGGLLTLINCVGNSIISYCSTHKQPLFLFTFRGLLIVMGSSCCTLSRMKVLGKSKCLKYLNTSYLRCIDLLDHHPLLAIFFFLDEVFLDGYNCVK